MFLVRTIVHDVHACTCIYVYLQKTVMPYTLEKNSLAVKTVRGQSEASLQHLKAKKKLIILVTEMQSIFTTTIDFVTWLPYCTSYIQHYL